MKTAFVPFINQSIKLNLHCIALFIQVSAVQNALQMTKNKKIDYKAIITVITEVKQSKKRCWKRQKIKKKLK